MVSVGIVILAAGASTRYGSPKQLLPFRGQSLLAHACRTALASPCRPVLVVLGAEIERLRPEIESLPVRIIENPQWREGMGSSIRAAMASLNAGPELEGVVLMLCDQPLLAPAIIDDLVQAHYATGKAIVASQYNDTLGSPALFGAGLFPELARLEGAGGAKRLFERHPELVTGIPFAAGEVDIDTPEDFERLRGLDADNP